MRTGIQECDSGHVPDAGRADSSQGLTYRVTFGRVSFGRESRDNAGDPGGNPCENQGDQYGFDPAIGIGVAGLGLEHDVDQGQVQGQSRNDLRSRPVLRIPAHEQGDAAQQRQQREQGIERLESLEELPQRTPVQR